MQVQEMNNAVQPLIDTIQKKIKLYYAKLKAMHEYRPRVSEDDPFVISFVGRFKTGKTSLINALLGEDFLPTKATTATAVVTKIRYGRTRAAYIEEKGKLIPTSIEKAKDIILYHSEKSEEELKTIVFYLPVRWLKKDVELRDTPGLDDSAMGGYLEHLAMHAIEESDLCIYVYDSASFVSAREVSNTLAVQEHLGGNIVLAVNRINLLNEESEIQEVSQKVKRKFGKLGNELVGTCRYYMMCSAAKMINLAGFDIWFKDLIKPRRFVTFKELKQIGFGQWLRNFIHPKRKKRLLAFRNTAQYGKDRLVLKAYMQEVEELRAEAVDRLAEMDVLHEEELKRRREEILKAGKARIRRGESAKDEIHKIIEDTSSLRRKLTGLTSENNWRANYKSLSKDTVDTYYVNLILELTEKHFPEHQFNFEAFTLKRTKTAYPGAKFAIFKSEAEVMRLSAARTIDMVEANLTPVLQEVFNAQIQSFLEKTEKEMNDAVRTCKTGLEDGIQKMRSLSSELGQIVKKMDKAPTVGLNG